MVFPSGIMKNQTTAILNLSFVVYWGSLEYCGDFLNFE
jgi:hypothetical protein